MMANKVINVEVSLKEVRGDQNKLIRKFIKKCKKERIVEDYLDLFENKDLDGLESFFSNDCTIRDWDAGVVSGKQKVMKIFSNIFDSFENIEVNIHHIHEDHGGIIICEMTLSLDSENLFVADIFEFDSENLINHLRAYRG